VTVVAARHPQARREETCPEAEATDPAMRRFYPLFAGAWHRSRIAASGALLGLSDANYRLYCINFFIASIAFWLQDTTQVWLVLQLTNSGAMVGLLAIFQYAPLVALGLVGGAATDRFDRRAVLQWTSAGLMGTAAVLAGLVLTGAITVPAIFAVAVVRSLLFCVNRPARQAFVVEIVGKPHLRNAIGINAAVSNLSRIVGPLLAGILISAVGTGVCFVVQAGAYLAGLCLLYRIRASGPPHADRKREPRSSVASLVETFGHLVKIRHLAILTLALALMSFIPFSFATVLPLLAVKTLHRDSLVYGLLFSSLAVGSVAGALVVASGERKTSRWIFGCAAVFGAVEALFLFQRSIFLSGLVLVVAGFCMTAFLSSINGILLLDTTERMHGRVAALYWYITGGLGPLGSGLSGWLSEIGGTDLAFGVGATIALGVATAGLLAGTPRYAGRAAERADIVRASDRSPPVP
jgi:MFS family permease